MDEVSAWEKVRVRQVYMIQHRSLASALAYGCQGGESMKRLIISMNNQCYTHRET